MPLDEDKLTEAMNKKTRTKGEKYSVRGKKQNREHVASLIEQHNALGDDAVAQKQALRSAIEALGGKLPPKPLPGGAAAAKNPGMGGPGGPPGDATPGEQQATGTVPDKHEFTGVLGELIDSRPDLREQLLTIARTIQLPAPARTQQMRKLIRDTPAPEQPETEAEETAAPPKPVPGAPPRPANARPLGPVPGRPEGFKLKPPTPPAKPLVGGNNPEKGKVDRPLIP